VAVQHAEPAVHLLHDLVRPVPGELLRQRFLVLAEVEELRERPGDALAGLHVVDVPARVAGDVVPGVLVDTAIGVGVDRERAVVAAVAAEQAPRDVFLALACLLRWGQVRDGCVLADGVLLAGLPRVDAAIAAVENPQLAAENAAAIESDDIWLVRGVWWRSVAEEDARPPPRPQRIPDPTRDLVKVGFPPVAPHLTAVPPGP